jgi:hypothetical protein
MRLYQIPLLLVGLIIANGTIIFGEEVPPELQTFFKEHCVQCHGEDKQKGDVRLDDISAINDTLWKDIFEQLASEEMPPDDEPQPSETERKLVQSHALTIAAEGTASVTTGF